MQATEAPVFRPLKLDFVIRGRKHKDILIFPTQELTVGGERGSDIKVSEPNWPRQLGRFRFLSEGLRVSFCGGSGVPFKLRINDVEVDAAKAGGHRVFTGDVIDFDGHLQCLVTQPPVSDCPAYHRAKCPRCRDILHESASRLLAYPQDLSQLRVQCPRCGVFKEPLRLKAGETFETDALYHGARVAARIVRRRRGLAKVYQSLLRHRQSWQASIERSLELFKGLSSKYCPPIVQASIHGGLFNFEEEWEESLWLWDLKGPLTLVTAFRLAEQLLDFLRESQSQGVFGHLGPQCVYYTVGRDVRLRIHGYGIEDALSEPGAHCLPEMPPPPTADDCKSLCFFSPELLNRREHTPASQIYSLGAILSLALSGQAPFMGETIMEVFRNVMEGRRPALRALNPAVPKVFANLIEAMLSREPGSRPTVEAARAELQSMFGR